MKNGRPRIQFDPVLSNILVCPRNQLILTIQPESLFRPNEHATHTRFVAAARPRLS
jgi:hypothetical protein